MYNACIYEDDDDDSACGEVKKGEFLYVYVVNLLY